MIRHPSVLNRLRHPQIVLLAGSIVWSKVRDSILWLNRLPLLFGLGSWRITDDVQVENAVVCVFNKTIIIILSSFYSMFFPAFHFLSSILSPSVLLVKLWTARRCCCGFLRSSLDFLAEFHLPVDISGSVSSLMSCSQSRAAHCCFHRHSQAYSCFYLVP